MNVDVEPLSQLTLSMTHEALVSHIKILYAELKMLEDKWIAIHDKQFKEPQSLNASRLELFSNEQWQALTFFPRKLIHLHYDLYTALQHPSAGPRLIELITPYSLPARMWKYGIQQLWKILRCGLPTTEDHI